MSYYKVVQTELKDFQTYSYRSSTMRSQYCLKYELNKTTPKIAGSIGIFVFSKEKQAIEFAKNNGCKNIFVGTGEKEPVQSRFFCNDPIEVDKWYLRKLTRAVSMIRNTYSIRRMYPGTIFLTSFTPQAMLTLG